MPHWLEDLTFDRVDLVPKGANQESHVVLFKRDEIDNNVNADESSVEKMPMTLKEVLAHEEAMRQACEDKWRITDAFMTSLRTISDESDIEASEKVRLITTSAAQFVQMMQPVQETLEQEEAVYMAGKTQKTDDKTEVSEELEKTATELEAEAKIVELTKERDKAIARAEAAEAEVEKMNQPENTEDDIWKGLPDALRQRFEKQEAEIAAAKAVAQYERDARERQECMAKASGFKGLPINPDDDWVIFKDLDALPEKTCKRMYELLRAADAVYEKAGLEEEHGFEGDDGTPIDSSDSAFGKIESLAKALVESGKAKSVPEAIGQVALDHPDLYDAYLKED